MCCDFSSTTCSAAKMRTMEINSSLVSRERAHTFRAYSTQGISNSNWSNSAVFFRRPISLAPKKKGLKPTGTLPSKTIFGTLVSFWRNSFPTDPLLFAIQLGHNWGLCTTGAQVGLVLPKTQKGRS